MIRVARYLLRPVITKYWKPGENFLEEIAVSVENIVKDGDFLTVSEKAVSTALGNIVNEEKVEPSCLARLIAKYWMRLVWGYFLGVMCHLYKRTVQRLREYPLIEGSRHKQVALHHAGFLSALMHGSEGGIDGSNLPYSYVSLPLPNPQEVAEKIRLFIRRKLRREVCVMIVDTDKTYSLLNFHFTPRPTAVKGICSLGGVISYIAGRFLRLKRRATPVAIAGCRLNVKEALHIAEIANRARGVGAGRTVWDMADIFDVRLTGVSWEMLRKVKHKPIVIVRRKGRYVRKTR